MKCRSVMGALAFLTGIAMLGCAVAQADPAPHEEAAAAAVEQTDDIGSASSELDDIELRCWIHNYPYGNQNCWSPEIGWNDCDNPTVPPKDTYCNRPPEGCDYFGPATKIDAFYDGTFWVGTYKVEFSCWG